MRDIIVTLLIFIGLGYTLRRPYIGILLWSWLGYMNPHRLCYGFAYSMPFSQLTAIITMMAIIFSKEPKKLPKDALVFLLFTFIVWMGITTFFSFESVGAEEQYIKIIKIQLPIFLTMMVFNTKEKVNQLLWVIIISLGYFGVKGGLFTILTGGSFRVWGPPGSFVEENNSLAVACLMVIPFMYYMKGTMNKKWHKQAMLFAIVSMCISVLGSQSRGALLAILVVGAYFVILSDRVIVNGLMVLVFIALLAAFLPESWYERMNTINAYDEDDSAMGRIRAWQLAINVANHNILGGGLNLWSDATYSKYLTEFDPDIHTSFVAHSIYFSVLAEHGWIGLFLFLMIFYIAWINCSSIIKKCADHAEKQWIANLTKMIKISLLAYFAGGAFLSLSYFDLPWHLVAVVVVLKEIEKNTKESDQFLINKPYSGHTRVKIKINSDGFIQ